MGDIFILIFKRITIFNSILMIIHCLFHPYSAGVSTGAAAGASSGAAS